VKRRFMISLAAIGLMASGMAAAQSDWNMPWQDRWAWYVGASGGQSKFRSDCASGFDCDTKDTGWKAYFGGNFNRILGVEVGYADFGHMRASGGDTEAQATNISLTAGVPIGERFSVFAKAGGAYSHTDVSVAPLTGVATGKKSGWGSTWGVGTSFAFTRNVLGRVDWDRYKLDFVGGEHDVDFLSAGLQVRF